MAQELAIQLDNLPRTFRPQAERGSAPLQVQLPVRSSIVAGRPHGMIHAEKQGFLWRIFLITFGVFFGTGGLATLFLLDVFVFNTWYRESGSVVTSADLSRILTISQA